MKNKQYNYKKLFFLIGIFIGNSLIAQQLNMDVRDVDGNIRVYDPANINDRRSGKLTYEDMEGTPFWNEKWNPAIVYFSNNTKAKINQARLNLYTDEIHYLSANGVELAIENQGITRLVFLNKNNLTQAIASFAKLNNHVTGNGSAYYRVFNAGLYQLILLQKQLVKTSPYDPILGKSISSFYSKKNYAIYNEGEIIPLKDLNRVSIIGATPNNNLIKESLKGDKTKLNNEKDVIEYLEQVNETFIKVGNKQ